MAFQSLMSTIKETLGCICHASQTLAAPIIDQFEHSSDLCTIDEDDIERLRSKLQRIRDSLKEADNYDITDLSVKNWLRELRDLDYCLEDVIEEIEFASLRVTTLDEFTSDLMTNAGSRKRKREVSHLYFPSPTSLRHKIRRIWDAYRDIASDREALRFREEDGTRKPSIPSIIATSSFPRERKLYGRDKDMEEVMKMMLSCSDDDHSNYSVISVVGMAGIGKTEIVQHLYHNQNTKSNFTHRIWVWASQLLDVELLTRKIVEQIPGCSDCPNDLQKLHNIMNEKLSENKYLLILDDVWLDDQRSWDCLKVPLDFGARGSKVIITTRSKKVAEMMCNEPYRLGCLSDEHCWSVCQEKFTEGGRFVMDTELLVHGLKMVSLCGGLPLAAKELAFVLRTSQFRELCGDVSEMGSEMVESFLPVVKVSFDYLPLHLKRCFAYCSLFPKGYIFWKHKLVQLWIAQGFIESNSELTGSRYFDELVERCFFWPSHGFGKELCKMHGLYHDLAERVSGNECCRVEGNKLPEIDRQTRHSSLVPKSNKYIQFVPSNGKRLRSLLFLGGMDDKPDNIPFRMNISFDLLENFYCIRALNLSNAAIEELPDSVGYLMHLRYLCLENTGIQYLPETICGLFKLQAMNLKHCNDLIELPRGLKLLSDLRNLDLPFTGNSNLWMPYGISKLTNLQKLSLFVVGSGAEGSKIQELGSLVNLGGDLFISGLNNVEGVHFAKEAFLSEKGKLQKLTLEWSIGSLNKNISSYVLNFLKPNQSLNKLVINGFYGTTFPAWLSDGYLANLVSLDLNHCSLSKELPSLGRLPSLKRLCAQSMPKVQRVGREFCGSPRGSSSNGNELIVGFPVLETLEFTEMDSWEEWDGVEETDFPSLRHLAISRCCKLKRWPCFRSSVNLQIQTLEVQMQNLTTTISAFDT